MQLLWVFAIKVWWFLGILMFGLWNFALVTGETALYAFKEAPENMEKLIAIMIIIWNFV